MSRFDEVKGRFPPGTISDQSWLMAEFERLTAEVNRLTAENASLRPIVERIMTQHWDMAACCCWVCNEGRAAGCRPRDQYLAFKHPDEKRERVTVEWAAAAGVVVSEREPS